MQVTNANEVKDMAAEALERTASSLRNTALDRGGQLGTMASKAAEAIGFTAGYLRQHDMQDMVSDAERVARKNPGAALVAAAAVGFLIGAALRK